MSCVCVCVWGDSGRVTHGVFIVDIDGQTKGTSVEWFTGSEAVHKRCLQVKQSNCLSSTTHWMQHIWTSKHKKTVDGTALHDVSACENFG